MVYLKYSEKHEMPNTEKYELYLIMHASKFNNHALVLKYNYVQ